MTDHLNNDHHKSNPYLVPESYFEELDARIKQDIMTDDISIPVENSFDVPRGYFDALEQEILKKRAKKSTLAYWIVSAAASLMLLIGLSIGLMPSSEENSNNISVDAQNTKRVETEALISYLEENYIDELDLAELEMLDLENKILSFPDISETNLQSYIDNEYDMDELIDDL